MGCKVVLMRASMKLHLTPKNKERATTIDCCLLGERTTTDNLNRKALESGLKQALLSVSF